MKGYLNFSSRQLQVITSSIFKFKSSTSSSQLLQSSTSSSQLLQSTTSNRQLLHVNSCFNLGFVSVSLVNSCQFLSILLNSSQFLSILVNSCLIRFLLLNMFIFPQLSFVYLLTLFVITALTTVRDEPMILW